MLLISISESHEKEQCFIKVAHKNLFAVGDDDFGKDMMFVYAFKVEACSLYKLQ